MKVIVSVLIFLVVIIYSCSASYIVDTNEATNFPEGRNLFVSKCNGCHKYHSPTEFTVAKWDSILVPMKEKAKLSEKERDLILSWISEKVNNDTLKNKLFN